MFCRTFLLVMTLVVPLEAGAQSLPDSLVADTMDVQRHLARMVDDLPSDDNASARIAERLSTLAEDPLDVNRASAADLASLPMLSPSAAHRIVRYRDQHGDYADVVELQSVEGLSASTLHAVRPYLTVKTSEGGENPSSGFLSFRPLASNLEVDLIQRFTRRLDLGRGYNDDSTRTSFLGPPGGLTTRLRVRHDRHAELALTLDQDPGEPFRWSPETTTYGFDHVAGSLTLRDLGPVETLVIGDFTPQFGQGVVLWRGISFGKGRNPVTPLLRRGRGIVPFRSASEDQFFRGTAATVRLPMNLSLSTFGSRRLRDASLESSPSSNGSETTLYASTLSSGGYHRTPTEIARKGTFGITTLGGALEYQHPSFHLGVAGYQSRFDHLLRPGDQPYRQFRVSGRRTAMVSAFADVLLGDYAVFGELGRSPNGTYGGVIGAALDERDTVQALLLARVFPSQFSNLYGQAVGEGSGVPQNEMGVYSGLRLQVAENWRIAAYFDQFRFPWLRFSVPRPSNGWDVRLLLEHDPRPWLSSYFQFRAKERGEGTERLGPDDRRLDAVQRERRASARWHTEYLFSRKLTLRTRLEASRFTTPTSTSLGFLLSQGLRLQPTSSLRLDARLAFFDTDGFDARIYTYEHDLLYSFSVPVFFDRGRRSYLLARYEPTSSLVLEAKYGVTSYINRSTIGSGLNEIDGSRLREISLQARWRL